LEDYIEKFLDPKGLYKNIDYPWINDSNRDIARYSDLLVFLYMKKFSDFLTPKRSVLLPFIAIAKIRFKYERFENLYEMRIVSVLYETATFLKSFWKLPKIYRVTEFLKSVKVGAAYRTQAFFKSFSLAPRRRLAAGSGTLPME